MDNKKLTFTEDQKSVVERELKSVLGSMSMLLDSVKKDELTEEMKEMLPKLIDSYFSQIKKTIGYIGEKSEREKEIEESIIESLRKEVEDLEKALKEQDSIASIAANVKMLFEKIKKWWRIEGFNYISECYITENGNVSLKFGFILESFTASYSDTPVTDRKNMMTKLDYLKSKGFEFAKKRRGYGLDIVDNDNNRKLLIEMVQEAFPSAKVFKFNNHLRSTKDLDCFVVRHMEVMIYDLSDIQNLKIKERQFLDDEDFE